MEEIMGEVIRKDPYIYIGPLLLKDMKEKP